MVYTADGTVAKKLLDGLGLPLTTDVIEWHSWAYVPPNDEPSYYSEVMADTPLAYYRLGDTSTTMSDSSGNGRNGTYYNILDDDTTTLGVPGLLDGDTDNAASFDGLDDFGFVTDAAWMNTGTITLEAIVKLASVNRVQNIMTRQGSSAQQVFQFRVHSTNKPQLIIWTVASGTTALVLTGATTLAQNTRYHLAGTYDGSTLRLYVNGVLDGSLAVTASPLVSKTIGLSVACLSASPTATPAQLLHGVVDESAIYSTALSATRLAAHAAAVSAPFPSDGSYTWQADEDRTAALVSYQVEHGRKSPLDNVGALTCTVNLARENLTDPIPTAGERFRLTLSEAVGTALGVDSAEWPRFTGEITDVEVLDGTQHHRPDAPTLTIVQVTAVGRMARLGRVPVPRFRRRAELDGRRVGVILTVAERYLDYELGTIDPGTVDLMAIDEENGNAGGLLAQVTVDSLGQLVEHRSGRLDWHDAEHRRDLVSAVTLDGPSHMIRPFRWSQAIGTVVNMATVVYGDARKSITVTDSDSADIATGLGPYGVTVETQLADRSAAHSLGSTIVGRYARPAWMLPEVVVDVVRTAGAQAGGVLALSHGDKITASGLPTDGPFTAGDLFVEGTTEAFSRTAWRVALAVADPTIAGVGLRWMDVPETETWAGVTPTLTWLDMATAEPADL